MSVELCIVEIIAYNKLCYLISNYYRHQYEAAHERQAVIDSIQCLIHARALPRVSSLDIYSGRSRSWFWKI